MATTAIHSLKGAANHAGDAGQAKRVCARVGTASLQYPGSIRGSQWQIGICREAHRRAAPASLLRVKQAGCSFDM